MKKAFMVAALVLLATALFAPLAVFAAEASGAPAGSASDSGKLMYYGLATLGCAVGIGLAAAGCGAGMGHGIRGALEGTARNPAVGGKLMTTLIIGLAMIESLAIYALVIVLITFYANPFVK